MADGSWGAKWKTSGGGPGGILDADGNIITYWTMDHALAAYKAWWRVPFPTGSERDDLGDLHGDLHVVFESVLSTVESFAEHGKIVPIRVDIAAGLSDL